MQSLNPIAQAINAAVNDKPKALKINDGNGITLQREDVKLPSFQVPFSFKYGPYDARFVLSFEYVDQDYYTDAGVEIFGRRYWEFLNEDTYYDLAEDGWSQYVSELFPITFFNGATEFEFPEDLIEMIERRLEMVLAVVPESVKAEALAC